MALNRRRLGRMLLAALGLLALLAAHDAWQLQRERQLDARIAAGGQGGDAADAPAGLRFALAYAQAASGAGEAALARYGTLQEDPAFGRAARFNSANLLLRQAIELREAQHPGQALALIELAKEHYRELLRQDPGDWDARYNLERAQRLVPDPEGEDESMPDTRRDAERAATTMRGHSPGLP
ncbi:MAG: MxaK protein [Piscinibacter sp.]|nr:MxaK protein [Piscinibacter sp.]